MTERAKMKEKLYTISLDIYKAARCSDSCHTQICIPKCAQLYHQLLYQKHCVQSKNVVNSSTINKCFISANFKNYILNVLNVEIYPKFQKCSTFQNGSKFKKCPKFQKKSQFQIMSRVSKMSQI